MASRAADLLFTGRMVSGAQAVAMDLASEVLPVAELILTRLNA